MHNSYLSAGVDVSADWLDAARQLGDAHSDGSDGSPDRSPTPEHRRFANTADGHAALSRWLCASGYPVRVGVEASGVYSLDLTLALHAAEDIEVMLVNPPARPRTTAARGCTARRRTNSTPLCSATTC